MAKKCIICDQNAVYKIKGSSEYYCEECAIEHFGDTEMLVKVEEEAKILKQIVKKKIEEELQNSKEDEDIESVEQERVIDHDEEWIEVRIVNKDEEKKETEEKSEHQDA